jgi:hypothetical protein
VLLALLVFNDVTMQTVIGEYDVPACGFPYPAFGFSGVSSGVWWVAPLALLLDALVAMIVTWPMAIVLRRFFARKVAKAAAWALAVLVCLLHVGNALAVVLGFLYVVLWYLHTDAPVGCRNLRIAPPDTTLDDTAEHSACIQRNLERIEAREEGRDREGDATRQTRRLGPDLRRTAREARQTRRLGPEPGNTAREARQTRRLGPDLSRTAREARQTRRLGPDLGSTAREARQTRRLGPDLRRTAREARQTRRLGPDLSRTAREARQTRRLGPDLKRTARGARQTRRLGPEPGNTAREARQTRRLGPDLGSTAREARQTRRLGPDLGSTAREARQTRRLGPDLSRTAREARQTRRLGPDLSRTAREARQTRRLGPDPGNTAREARQTRRLGPDPGSTARRKSFRHPQVRQPWRQQDEEETRAPEHQGQDVDRHGPPDPLPPAQREPNQPRDGRAAHPGPRHHEGHQVERITTPDAEPEAQRGHEQQEDQAGQGQVPCGEDLQGQLHAQQRTPPGSPLPTTTGPVLACGDRCYRACSGRKRPTGLLAHDHTPSPTPDAA